MLTLQLELKQSHLGWARKTPEISKVKTNVTKTESCDRGVMCTLPYLILLLDAEWL